MSGFMYHLKMDSSVQLKDEIVRHLCNTPDVHFKNQQINDPDLTVFEKTRIVESVLEKGITLFLTRFGKHLTPSLMEYFKDAPEEEQCIVQHYIMKLLENQDSKKKIVRNRRFEAMKQLMNEGTYFSKTEMKARNPLMYEQLVGQFLNPDERDHVDRIDTNMTLVNLLLHQIDRDSEDTLKEEQRNSELIQQSDKGDPDTISKKTYSISLREQSDVQNEVENDSSDEEEASIQCSVKLKTNSVSSEKLAEKKMPQQLWGESMTDEPISKPVAVERAPFVTSSSQFSQVCKNKLKNVQISEKEKGLLFEEFRSHMISNFLDGKDQLFNYSDVDSNPAYDDLNMTNQDAEDNYFSKDDEVLETELNESNMVEDHIKSDMVQSESEDELDKFMNNLESEIQCDELSSQIKRF